MAEIQQSSDATFRLFDWNRVGPDGQPRPLHVEQAFEVIDFRRGPLSPVRPQPTERPEAVRLVECDKFVLDRWEIDSPVRLGGDARFHILAVLAGALLIEGDPAGRPPLARRDRAVARRRRPRAACPAGNTVLLDAYLP